MKKIDFRQRAAKTEERKRKSKYADVMVRATVMGLMKLDEDVDRMMDIESADKKHTYSAWLQEEMKKREAGGDMGEGMEPETGTEPGRNGVSG